MASSPVMNAIEKFAELNGRRTVVTGSSSGIGRAIALEFARAGADVVVHSRTERREALEVRDECRRLGRRSELVAEDFSSACDWEEFVDRAWRRLGGIEVWVNNAGTDLLTTPTARSDFREKLEALLDVDV